MPTVLIVHDDRLFAEALQLAVDADPHLRCVGMASCGTEAVDTARTVDPDRCLLDLDPPSTDGLDTCRMLHSVRPEMDVTVLAGSLDLDLLRRAQQAGAANVLSKRASIAEVLSVLGAPGPRGFAIDDRMVIDLSQRRSTCPGPDGAMALTDREVDVLRGMAAGDAPKVIAAGLGISVHTVRGHVKGIYWKLGAHNQLEAVAIARRRGLVEQTG